MSDIEWTDDAVEATERDMGAAEMFSDFSSEAALFVLDQIGDPDHPVYKIIAAHALRAASAAFQAEGLSLKPDVWGSDPADQQTIASAISVAEWMSDRADLLDPPKEDQQ